MLQKQFTEVVNNLKQIAYLSPKNLMDESVEMK